MKLKIKRICIEGIRGYKDKKELDFDAPCIFLFGDNGSGKSNTLNAIEWVLFGDKMVGKETGIPERSRQERWKIENLDYGNKPKVTMTFIHSDREYIIERSQSDLTITKPDKTQLKNSEAEKWLYKILQIEFKDFMSSIYQHQEIIRDILVKEPKVRNDVLDRLFGLSDLKNFITGIDTDIKKERDNLLV